MNSKIRKFGALLLAFLLMLTACGSNANKDKEDTSKKTTETQSGEKSSEEAKDAPLGVAILAADHGWLAALSYNAEEKVKETGINAKILKSNNIGEQASNIDDLIGMKASVIVLEPHTDEVANYAKKIVDAGIPLVLFDRIVDVNYTSYVTGNNPKVGLTVAEYLGEKLQGKGTVAVHNVPSAGSVSTERVDNFKKVMAEKYPKIKLVEFQTASFTQEDGLKSGADLLTANPNLDAIFSIDDESSLGFLQAIKDAGRTDIKYISGCGGSQSYFNKIKEEKNIHLFSATYSPKMIRDAIDVAIKVSKGEKVEKDIFIDPKIVNSENVGDFIDANSPY
ncbi:substrate-binding domain-containing protein [Peptoniphilaceae bacterium SGI.131]